MQIQKIILLSLVFVTGVSFFSAGETSASYVPKRIVACQDAFIGVSYDTQVKVDKKYRCKKLWAEWTRELLLSSPY